MRCGRWSIPHRRHPAANLCMAGTPASGCGSSRAGLIHFAGLGCGSATSVKVLPALVPKELEATQDQSNEWARMRMEAENALGDYPFFYRTALVAESLGCALVSLVIASHIYDPLLFYSLLWQGSHHKWRVCIVAMLAVLLTAFAEVNAISASTVLSPAVSCLSPCPCTPTAPCVLAHAPHDRIPSRLRSETASASMRTPTPRRLPPRQQAGCDHVQLSAAPVRRNLG